MKNEYVINHKFNIEGEIKKLYLRNMWDLVTYLECTTQDIFNAKLIDNVIEFSDKIKVKINIDYLTKK